MTCDLLGLQARISPDVGNHRNVGTKGIYGGLATMKTFYWLDGPYEGLKVRRLERFGSIVFDQVINDGAPYWFVTIRSFEPDRDQPILRELFGEKWGNGTRRFVSMADAQTYFERLKTVPLYQELEQKRLALEKWRRESALNRLSPLGKGKNPAVK